MNLKTYLPLPATVSNSIRPRRCQWLHHRLRHRWFPLLNFFLWHYYTWRLGHCCTWGWWPAGSSSRGRGGAPGCWRYFTLYCTAPSCRNSAQDDTIADDVGVWCSLLLGDNSPLGERQDELHAVSPRREHGSNSMMRQLRWFTKILNKVVKISTPEAASVALSW